MKLTLVIFTFFIFNSGCGDGGVNKGVVQQIAGPYSGIIPCADCEGINYELNLNDDMTYTERLIYIGKNVQPFWSSGQWTMEGNNKVKLYKKSDDLTLFEFSKPDLILLDHSGKRVEGPLADKHVLKAGSMQFINELGKDASNALDEFKDSTEQTTSSTETPNSKSLNSDSLNGKWNLIEINGMKPEAGNYIVGIPDLEIKEADNKFSCNTGCNRVNGGVQIKGSQISFSKFLGTKISCPGTSEKELISTMTAVESYTIENGLLNLKAAGKTVLKFSR